MSGHTITSTRSRMVDVWPGIRLGPMGGSSVPDLVVHISPSKGRRGMWRSNRASRHRSNLVDRKSGNGRCSRLLFATVGDQKCHPKALFGDEGAPMDAAFSPTRKDVRRYRNLRASAMDLNQRIIKTIPPQPYHDMERAIGILHKGFLDFDTDDM